MFEQDYRVDNFQFVCIETRCGVDTRDGNGEGLCCVFPFNYRGVDYYTCTTADASEPWCSITRNYDRDGL